MNERRWGARGRATLLSSNSAGCRGFQQALEAICSMTTVLLTLVHGIELCYKITIYQAFNAVASAAKSC